MNKFLVLILGITLLATACQKDDDTFGDVLKYDGVNDDAPVLIEGTYEAAVRFGSSTMSNYTGRLLEEIEFYIHDDLPNECIVKIYKGGSTSPGSVVYEADVTANISTRLFNSHVLTDPLTIENDSYWFSIYLKHDTTKKSIGCDAGPADSNGDWFYDSTLNEWNTFRDLNSGNIDINWNIRGHLKPE